MVGHKSNWAVLDKKISGYCIDSQEMVDAGLRDPSEFIEAN
ncbi:hypothetical protein HKBW3S03_01521 [Candidatus Hakubella thermalkaliphila]|nr:hypothetical protein HKBW3S03_01521 [Candidatus Hakubella thermalkaliphila]GFP41191.1 hypothetical protein HKBW3C_00317 [Candidatus Hakubella thermalkaliphila]